jgi:hypothetical protein
MRLPTSKASAKGPDSGARKATKTDFFNCGRIFKAWGVGRKGGISVGDDRKLSNGLTATHED